MKKIVVFEANYPGVKAFWAWCEVNEDGLGFETVRYTTADGLEPFEPDHTVRLGTKLFDFDHGIEPDWIETDGPSS